MWLNRRLWRTGLVILATGLFANGLALSKFSGLSSNLAQPRPTVISAIGSIEVAFSPNNGVTNRIVVAINQAEHSILVAAYSFTSKDIAAALLAAKKRGVSVQLLLDKSQISHKYSSSTFFANQGLSQRIDIQHAIYHDKYMVIDAKTVITGSFNFTKAAETKNAENILILRNNPELAKLYTQDWWANWQRALPRSEFLLKYSAKPVEEDEHN